MKDDNNVDYSDDFVTFYNSFFLLIHAESSSLIETMLTFHADFVDNVAYGCFADIRDLG